MGQFSSLWPALGATGALLVFLLGYRMARTSPRDYLDAEDLILLQGGASARGTAVAGVAVGRPFRAPTASPGRTRRECATSSR